MHNYFQKFTPEPDKERGMFYSVAQPDVLIRIFGAAEAHQNGLTRWSLDDLHGAPARKHLISTALGIELRKLRVCRAYAPNGAAGSARVLDSRELRERVRLGRNTFLHRNSAVSADGVFLERGEAFVAVSAGDPLIIAGGGEYAIVANAPLESLVAPEAVTGALLRRRVSIVHAIVELLRKRGVRSWNILLCLQFAPPPEACEYPLDDPEEGAYRRALGAYVDERWPGCATRPADARLRLDCEALVIEQARQIGITRAWATRGGELLDGNLVIVRRNA